MKKERIFNVAHTEESSGFLLWQVSTLWQRAIKKALEPHDLTHPQFVLLASTLWLTLHEQEVTQILLALHTKIDPMTTSQVLRILEKKGLLERHTHVTDTRAKSIRLTKKGELIAKQAVKSVEKFDHDFFLPLDAKTGDFNKKLAVLLTQKQTASR